MPKRAKDWNEGLSKDLKDPKFAQEFLLAAIEEGISLQVALGKLVRAFGVKEFAKKVHMASSNLVRAITPGYNPTQETINNLLKPFKLMLTVTPIEEYRKKAA